MGLRRFANKRDANEPQIVAALERMGCEVIRMDKPVDLLIRIGRKCHLAEVKTRKGVLTDEQEAFMGRWDCWVLRDEGDVVEMVNWLRKVAA